MTIFGVPWAELELRHVEAFLAVAGGESLTWETKGTALPPRARLLEHGFGASDGWETKAPSSP